MRAHACFCRGACGMRGDRSRRHRVCRSGAAVAPARGSHDDSDVFLGLQGRRNARPGELNLRPGHPRHSAHARPARVRLERARPRRSVRSAHVPLSDGRGSVLGVGDRCDVCERRSYRRWPRPRRAAGMSARPRHRGPVRLRGQLRSRQSDRGACGREQNPDGPRRRHAVGQGGRSRQGRARGCGRRYRAGRFRDGHGPAGVRSARSRGVVVELQRRSGERSPHREQKLTAGRQRFPRDLCPRTGRRRQVGRGRGVVSVLLQLPAHGHHHLPDGRRHGW